MRSSLEGVDPNFKWGGKHDSLSWSPDLAKLNPNYHLNYS